MQNRKPGWQWATVALFLGCLLVPAADLVFGLDPNPSPLRDVVPFPSLQRDGLRRWPLELRRYVQTSMGFRGALVRARGLLAYHWLGTSPEPRLVIRADPWLFFKGQRVLEDYRRTEPFSDAEVRRWVAVFEGRRQWLAARKIPYLLVLAPNKETIYADAMPAWISRRSGPSRLEQLVQHLQTESQVEFLDLTPVLNAAKTKGRVYYHTDTHWNDLGAFEGYRAVAKRLGAWFPGVTPPERAQMIIEPVAGKGGDLARMCGLQADLRELRLDVQGLKGVAPARFENGDEVSAGRMDVRGATRLVTTSADAPIASAVVLRDSFGDALLPHLARILGRGVWLSTYDFPLTTLAEERPALVIQELVERELMVLEPGSPPPRAPD